MTNKPFRYLFSRAVTRTVSLCLLASVVAILPVFDAAAAPPHTKAKPPKAKPPAKAAPVAPPVVEKPAPAGRMTPVGLPYDAGPHDNDAVIEWWYYNALLKSEKGHRYAVIASFFRTGLPSQRKGHYLLYSLADLDLGTQTSYSVVDKSDAALLNLFLAQKAMQNPSDPRPLDMMRNIQQGILPPPHRLLSSDAFVHSKPPFSITMEENSLTQASDDARSWMATLSGKDSGFGDWTLELSLTQPPARSPMLVGGQGKTGLSRPDDMFYLSLTHMAATGTLTSGGVVEKLSGIGWLDRQWGTSWVVQDNGWDWFGLHLSDGSDLIAYRIRDNKTGKILKTEATLLAKDGTQTVETAPVFAPAAEGAWPDPASGAVFPQAWTVTLPQSGTTLTIHSAFPEQAIPVLLGVGEAIWEGTVSVDGTTKDGTALTGQGYMELVGYKKPAGGASASAPSVGAK